MCVGNSDIKLYDELMRPLEWNTLDKSLWTDRCDYIDMEKCDKLNNNSMNLIVLQLNVRSLLAHQGELKDLLINLEKRNSPVDILLLCETFLTKRMHKLINIPGYTLLSNNHEQSKGGGTAILVKKPYKLH